MPTQPGVPESPAQARPLPSEVQFDGSSKIVNAREYVTNPAPIWERWYQQIKTARMMRRVEQGKPPLTQRQLQRMLESMRESSARFMGVFENAPTSIGKLTREQLLQQIHTRYPEGLQPLLLRQPNGADIPMRGESPLSGDQDAYLAVAKSQGRAKPEEIENVRRLLESMNYIYSLYERYGGPFIQPNQPPYMKDPSRPISVQNYRLRTNQS